MLDADEFLSPGLADELQRRLPIMMTAGDAAVGILRRSTWYMGAPMRWYRPMVGERKARIYHRRRARWADVRVHESLQFDGTAVAFETPFIHLHNPTLVHKQLKVLRYAELKCRDWRDKQKPARVWLTPLVYLAAFLKDYLLRLAMLDGWRGLIVAHTAAAYAVYKRMRKHEFRTKSHPGWYDMRAYSWLLWQSRQPLRKRLEQWASMWSYYLKSGRRSSR